MQKELENVDVERRIEKERKGKGREGKAEKQSWGMKSGYHPLCISTRIISLICCAQNIGPCSIPSFFLILFSDFVYFR